MAQLSEGAANSLRDLYRLVLRVKQQHIIKGFKMLIRTHQRISRGKFKLVKS